MLLFHRHFLANNHDSQGLCLLPELSLSSAWWLASSPGFTPRHPTADAGHLQLQLQLPLHDSQRFHCFWQVLLAQRSIC